MSQTASAWNEIIEQIFGDFLSVDNATPDWLVDPETGHRLKLDKLYPELGLAIRFEGSMGTSQMAALDEIDLMEEAARNERRVQLCRQADVALIVIDADSDTPGKTLAQMRTALSSAARRIVQRRVAQEARLYLLPRIALAKATCQRILRTVSSSKDLLPFAQAWEDRQFGKGRGAAADAAPTRYQPGTAVRHSECGEGLVLRVVPGEEEGESEIVVQFADASTRVFSASQARHELRIGG